MQSLSTILGDNEKLKSMYRLAGFMAKSKLMIPQHLIGNAADCFAVILLATRLNMCPYSLSNQTYMIKGRLGFQAQLVNALATNADAIEGSFKYEFKDWQNGNGWFRVGAKLKGDEEITWAEWTDTSTVAVKNSPLWKTNPKQQACYLGVRNFVRLYCPSVLIGVYTPDELNTIKPEQTIERDVTPIAELLESKQVEPVPVEQLVSEQPEGASMTVCDEATEFFGDTNEIS